MSAEQQPDDSGQSTETPEIQEEHREAAKEMAKEYEDDRPTVTMPGTGGAISGTAINDWLDDDGNPKFSDDSPQNGS